MTSAASNRQIVEELQSGDRAGCVHLLDAYQDRLTWEGEHVFRLLHEDSEEIVSDVLLTVVRKARCFRFRRGDGDFHFWVMAIFRNRVKDFLRHKALTKGVMECFDEERPGGMVTQAQWEAAASFSRMDPPPEKVSEELTSEPISGEAGALQRVAETLDRMEPWERVLLRCRALDVSYDEIAEYTGKSPKQLKVYLARVKKKFLRLYEECCRERTTQ
jgi:RNA polymerase sigma factor (sigma-70 family)